MPDPIPLRSPSMHDNVAARLRAMVFERQLAPGDWVDEKALAAAWQISRTPLREALKVLAAEGLLELVPQRGCRVVALTDDDADQLFPVMALLEGRCAYEATRNATPADRAELQRCHDLLEQQAAAQDIDGYYRANHVFHSLVQRLARNRWLDRSTGDLRKFMRLMRGRQLKWPGRLGDSINEHRVLIAAMLQGDAARAERAMHDHLMAQLQALRALRSAQALGATGTLGAGGQFSTDGAGGQFSTDGAGGQFSTDDAGAQSSAGAAATPLTSPQALPGRTADSSAPEGPDHVR